MDGIKGIREKRINKDPSYVFMQIKFYGTETGREIPGREPSKFLTQREDDFQRCESL